MFNLYSTVDANTTIVWLRTVSSSNLLNALTGFAPFLYEKLKVHDKGIIWGINSFTGNFVSQELYQRNVQWRAKLCEHTMTKNCHLNYIRNIIKKIIWEFTWSYFKMWSVYFVWFQVRFSFSKMFFTSRSGLKSKSNFYPRKLQKFVHFQKHSKDPPSIEILSLDEKYV